MSYPPGSHPLGSYDASSASLPDYPPEDATDAAPALLSYTDAVAVLRMWWVNEVSAPAILPFQTHAVASLRHHLDEFTAILDAESAAANFSPLQEARVLDLDRSAYVYKSYLRVRLGKIHDSIITLSADSDAGAAARSRLSPAERTFAARYFQSVVQKRLQGALLADLPPRWAKLDEADDAPNLDRTFNNFPKAILVFSCLQ